MKRGTAGHAQGNDRTTFSSDSLMSGSLQRKTINLLGREKILFKEKNIGKK